VLAELGNGIVTDWLSAIEFEIGGNPLVTGNAMSLKVVDAVTVTELFVLAAGEAADAETVTVAGASALAAADRLVQPDGICMLAAE
jgi:hypothetical protein